MFNVLKTGSELSSAYGYHEEVILRTTVPTFDIVYFRKRKFVYLS